MPGLLDVLLENLVYVRTQRNSPRRCLSGEAIEQLWIEMDWRYEMGTLAEELASRTDRKIVFVLH